MTKTNPPIRQVKKCLTEVIKAAMFDKKTKQEIKRKWLELMDNIKSPEFDEWRTSFGIKAISLPQETPGEELKNPYIKMWYKFADYKNIANVHALIGTTEDPEFERSLSGMSTYLELMESSYEVMDEAIARGA